MIASSDEVVPSFVDTNVLVYSLDRSDTIRQPKARQLLTALMDGDALRTSTQVLSEFFVASTRKIRVPISEAEALDRINELAGWPVISTDLTLVRQACKLSISAKISYWEALIVAAAARAGAKRLYSEDFTQGQRLLGVEIVNPFRP